MFRTILLVLRNEFRLLVQDRAALFMLSLAPLVIIAVSGFSLGNMFGVHTNGHSYVIPVVNEDHGAVAKALIDGLSHERTLKIEHVPDEKIARTIVAGNDDSPLAIMIPSGTTEALESGRTASVSIYVDPVKRIEASAMELRLSELSRAIAERGRRQAQAQLVETSADLHARTGLVLKQVKTLQAEADQYQHQMLRVQDTLRAQLESRIREKAEQLTAQTQAAIDSAIAANKLRVQGELSGKQDAMMAVANYMHELQASRTAFGQWLAQLKTMAGSHAASIPPPPMWPVPPSAALLAELSKPVELSFAKPDLTAEQASMGFAIQIPQIRMPPMPKIALDLDNLLPNDVPALPGDIAWRNRALTPGYGEVNSFDQYVPGFGITFLLIDLLWGVSVGLIDEREWGTLRRLRASGAPVPAMMIGKLAARFLVGFVQMILLFSVGWLVFGIGLGRDPAVLLLPTAAIVFAAAAFGLVMAGICPTRDSVMPLGSVAAMTMSAVGGCWWPLNFEPSWMRDVASWMPTTWTMRAYNDLMIRGLDPMHAVWPSLVTFGLGFGFLAIGVLAASRIYD
ncbi:MAG TPA: ABC transporter permease [Candidatus Binataceae bacterium]|nr:ABC transporter permease [Candidatus Binataceae bacterium]